MNAFTPGQVQLFLGTGLMLACLCIYFFSLFLFFERRRFQGGVLAAAAGVALVSVYIRFCGTVSFAGIATLLCCLICFFIAFYAYFEAYRVLGIALFFGACAACVFLWRLSI